MRFCIGNYNEVRAEGYQQPSRGTLSQCCHASYSTYMQLVARSAIENIDYYYADAQRNAMKKDGAVYYLYGDQLGSVSAVADASGIQISRTLYHPWGTTRHTQGASPTDYAYTGQMQVDDIYYYNARWYDPAIGRFMQADTLVPPHQGTQGFDRYAYVNNNPMRYTDSSGHFVEILAMAAIGALVGGVINYGIQVVSNIIEDGEVTSSAFTDVDVASIVASAAAGLVGGGIGAGGISLFGSGLTATIGTGAVSGFVSGRVGKATYNVATGRDIQDNLWDPVEIVLDTAGGAAMAGIGYGVRNIKQSTFHNGDFPETSSSRYLLRGGNRMAFAEYDSSTQRIMSRTDLTGSSHAGVPTPHRHFPFWNQDQTTGVYHLNGWKSASVVPYNRIKAFFIETYINFME